MILFLKAYTFTAFLLRPGEAVRVDYRWPLAMLARYLFFFRLWGFLAFFMGKLPVLAACRRPPTLGGPQDIEWAWAEDHCYLRQCRPITQLPPPPYDEMTRRVWDNSNIQESYCGVTTPLTYSFARRAYATVYRQTMRLMGIPAATIAAHEPVLENLPGLVWGRVYHNINH